MLENQCSAVRSRFLIESNHDANPDENLDAEPVSCNCKYAGIQRSILATAGIAGQTIPCFTASWSVKAQAVGAVPRIGRSHPCALALSVVWLSGQQLRFLRFSGDPLCALLLGAAMASSGEGQHPQQVLDPQDQPGPTVPSADISFLETPSETPQEKGMFAFRGR